MSTSLPQAAANLTADEILAALTPGSDCEALLRAMYVEKAWLLKPMLESLDRASLPSYLGEVADIWSVMRAARPGVPERERLAEGMKGLAFHSMEFLKRQIEFAKTGEYKATDYDTVYREVYSNGAVMAQYLDGLLLTYVAWPNHYRLLKWYRDAFLARAKPGECLEIGPGHGWLALWQLRSNPANSLLGLDISPHSVAYSRSVLTAAGIAPARWNILERDAQRGIEAHAKPFDRVVIAEVIEHLAKPEIIVNAARKRSHADTLFFLTTVVNIEAVDHIHLFRSLQEVRDFCTDACGLQVVDELDLPLRMNLKMEDEAFEVALVCRPA
jgi:2-polyprenyl-3-methyl-5-hydroxy-6-metoxy-1,4-benzoquinol methylase